MKRLACAILAMAIGVSVLPVMGDGPVVSSRRALSQTIRELNVDGISLGKTLDYLRDTSGANIVVNWKVLETVGVAKETPITMQVRNLTLNKMLQLVLDQSSPNSQLVFSVESNVIQITTQDEADKHMITKVYVVDDLVMAPIVRQAPSLSLGVSSQQAGGGGGSFGGSGSMGGSSGSSGGGIFGGSSNSQQQTQVQKTADERGEELATLVREVVRPTIWKENGGTASIRYFSGKLIVSAPISVHEAIGGPVGDSVIRYGN